MNFMPFWQNLNKTKALFFHRMLLQTLVDSHTAKITTNFFFQSTASLTPHIKSPTLAVLGHGDSIVQIFKLNTNFILPKQTFSEWTSFFTALNRDWENGKWLANYKVNHGIFWPWPQEGLKGLRWYFLVSQMQLPSPKKSVQIWK